jgi:hypothetical protein
LAEVGDGAVVLVPVVPYFAAADVGGDKFRIKRDRLVQVSDRTVIRTLAFVGVAAVDVGGSKFRIELDGLVEVDDCTVVLALVGVEPAAKIVGDGIFLITLEHAIARGNRGIACPVPARFQISGSRSGGAQNKQRRSCVRNHPRHERILKLNVNDRTKLVSYAEIGKRAVVR